MASSRIAPALAAALVAAALATAAPVRAQGPSDRIMAVVGTDLLLESEWSEQALVLAGQVGIEPTGPEFAALARDAFEQMIRDMVIVAAAGRDTMIQISEERVLEEVDAEIARIRQRFPSDAEFQRQIRESQWGSLAAYRADLQERKRSELLGQAFLERRRADLEPRPVAEEEVRAYWEENRESFGVSPERVRFEEIPITLSPTAAAREAARVEAERVLAELEAGRDFATLARQFSDDSVSGRQGGDMGWFGRGQMVTAFEEAAFAATPGAFVGPVETPYGWHLIQVLDQRGEEVRARHILLAHEMGPEDRTRARAEAEALAAAIAAGADLDSLRTARMPAGEIPEEPYEIPRAQLPPAYGQALEALAPGAAAVVETPTGFSVVIARGTAGGVPVTYEEMAPRIRRQIAQLQAEEEFVERLRGEVYVDVRVRPEDVL